MTSYTDEELVRRYVETGLNTYYGQLYSRYWAKVYHKCLLFSKDPALAKDLSHDIFLKLVSKLSGFRGQAKFSTWLYSITSNYCTDQLRQLKLRQALFVAGDWPHQDVAQEEDETEVAEQEALQVEWSLQQLPPLEQVMLRLKYQEKSSIREIAVLYGLTECSVKMRLKRSRDKLRQLCHEPTVA